MVLLVGLLGISAGCDAAPNGAAKPTTVAATTTTRSATPSFSFSDWRVAYVDNGSALHAVSVDGRSDLTGPSLAGLARYGYNVASGGFSPDGHLLSYWSSERGLSLLDVVTNLPISTPSRVLAHDLRWSSDGSLLAAGDNAGTMDTIQLPEGVVTHVPPPSSGTLKSLIGWLDATHLLVTWFPPSTATPPSTPVSSGGPSNETSSVTLYALDIHSGTLRAIVTLTSSTMGIPYFWLSPDGKTVLYDNSPFRDYPFAPDVALIDVKTGAVTHLPHTASATGSGFTGVAFLPGTHTIAASQGFFEGGRFQTWLLDTAHDTATPLQKTAGVTVGWVPGTHTLILTTGTQATIGRGPYTISAVPDPVANLQAEATTLTTQAWTYPWLGFVKTA